MSRRSLLALATVASALAFAAAPAGAHTYYASPSGSGNCESATPCALADAVAAASDGDFVELSAGTFTPSSALTIGNAITLSGAGAGQTLIDAGSDGISLNNASALISDLAIEASGGYAALRIVSGTADRIKASNDVSSGCWMESGTLTNSLCVSSGSGAGLSASYSNGTYAATFSGDTFVGEGSTARGMNLIFDGGGIGTPIVNWTLTSIVASAENAPGLSTYASTDGSRSLHFYYSGIVGTLGAGPGLTGVSYSLEDHNFYLADPRFVGGGDYRLADDSPLIDAGSASGSFDLDGTARVKGAAADVGAYEHAAVGGGGDGGGGGGNTLAPVLDTTKPILTITKKPKSKGASKKLKVIFKADETVTFTCKLDKGPFKTCKSPYKKTVKAGKHTLKIKATDAAGNPSLIKTVKWTVKKK